MASNRILAITTIVIILCSVSPHALRHVLSRVRLRRRDKGNMFYNVDSNSELLRAFHLAWSYLRHRKNNSQHKILIEGMVTIELISYQSKITD